MTPPTPHTLPALLMQAGGREPYSAMDIPTQLSPPSTKPTQPAILRAPPRIPDFLRGLTKLTAFPPSAPSILKPFSASHPLGPTPNQSQSAKTAKKTRFFQGGCWGGGQF